MHEAKTNLSRLVERAASGEDVVIAKDGKPVARLVPIKRRLTPRPLGTMRGLIHVPDDFDDPMPDWWLKLFYEGEVFPPEEGDDEPSA